MEWVIELRTVFICSELRERRSAASQISASCARWAGTDMMGGGLESFFFFVGGERT